MRPTPNRRHPSALAVTSALFLAALTQPACVKDRVPLPGHTGYAIESVSFPGTELDVTELVPKLGMRAATLIAPGQHLNPFRAHEDRRRVAAFWQNFGYFDVTVDPPEIHKDEASKRAKVIWHVHPGVPYTIGSVHLVHAPPAHRDALRSIADFDPGDPVDMERYRLMRRTMNDYLRRHGTAHAETYSRAYVDKAAKKVQWYYFFDPGPPTRVGHIRVHGAHDVPAEDVLRRVGVKPGDPFDQATREKAELDLLDTGAFTVAHIQTDAHNEFLLGALPPDTGGLMRYDQVAPDGSLVPRKLDPNLDVDVYVVEAPSARVRTGVGATLDPERLDTFARADLRLPGALGALHNLSFAGRLGYGWLWRGATEDPLGLYGDAEARYDHPGFIHRLLDLRLTTRFDERLFPTFHTRRLLGALGFRLSPASHVFADLELRARYEKLVGLPVPATTAAAANHPPPDRAADPAALATDDLLGAEAAFSLVWDTRGWDPVEALDGHLVKLRATLAPGGPLGSHSYLATGADLRAFVPVGRDLSLGFRAAGDWVLLAGANGVPPGVRLFGGGAFGARGFAAQRLTAYARACPDGDPASATCRDVGVGARSLVQASVDLRWLPFRKQVGANAFVDLGGAGAGLNPFDQGVSVAVGLGGRVRLWYLPMSLDLSYRVTDNPAYATLDRFLVFFRMGEAF